RAGRRSARGSNVLEAGEARPGGAPRQAWRVGEPGGSGGSAAERCRSAGVRPSLSISEGRGAGLVELARRLGPERLSSPEVRPPNAFQRPGRLGRPLANLADRQRGLATSRGNGRRPGWEVGAGDPL